MTLALVFGKVKGNNNYQIVRRIPLILACRKGAGWMEQRRKSVGFAFVLLLAMLVLLPVFPVHAEVRQPIDEANALLVLPDELQYITRNSTEEEFSDLYGVTKEAGLGYMDENSAYLQGYNDEMGYEIQFQAGQTSAQDYNTYTDSELFQHGKELVAQNEEENPDIVGSGVEVYTGTQGQKYLIWRVDYKENDGSDAFAIENRTCLNGVQYSFYVWPYDEDLTGAAKKEVLGILDKVEYPQSAVAPAQPGTQQDQQGDIAMPNSTQAISNDPLVTALSTLIAVLVYLLPIVIYRYFIRKKPLKQGSALPVTLLYGTVVLLVVAILGYTTGLSALVAVAVLLCSVLVYLMLHSGRGATVAEVPAQASPNNGTFPAQPVPPVTPAMPNAAPYSAPTSTPAAQPAPSMQSGMVPPAPPAAVQYTQPVQPAAWQQPVAGAAEPLQPQNQRAQQHICRNCGRMLQQGDLYCGYCGTKTGQGPDTQN